ncbi:MAG: hypothetical protein KIS78_19885 [Labilithrix sp.]|nr:hypothetical protein [Labilithrix sp.]
MPSPFADSGYDVADYRVYRAGLRTMATSSACLSSAGCASSSTSS